MIAVLRRYELTNQPGRGSVVQEIMKSQSLNFVVLVFLVAIFSLSIVAQDQPSKVDKLTQRAAKARVQSAITNKQVKALIASAKSPEDHFKLPVYSNQEADRTDADAKGHEELAGVYRQNPNTFVPKGGGAGIFRTAEHCGSAAKSLREAGTSLRELAAEHEQAEKDLSK